MANLSIFGDTYTSNMKFTPQGIDKNHLFQGTISILERLVSQNYQGTCYEFQGCKLRFPTWPSDGPDVARLKGCHVGLTVDDYD